MQIKDRSTRAAEAFYLISREFINRFFQDKRKHPNLLFAFLAHFISRGVVLCNEIGRLPIQQLDIQEILAKSVDILMTPKSGFLELPTDVSQFILRCDRAVAFAIWENLSLADESYHKNGLEPHPRKVTRFASGR